MNEKSDRDPSQKTILEMANYYAEECHMSVIPFRRNDMNLPHKGRSKRPATEWKQYQSARADQPTLANWFNNNKYGIGVVLGAISGNLVVFDIEFPDVAVQWEDKVDSAGIGDWLKKAVKVRSGGGGVHYYFRLDYAPSAGRHLARRPVPEGTPDLLMEVLAEGHLALLPGSPADCHPDNNEYVLESGDFGDIMALTSQQFEFLCGLGEDLDDMPKVLDTQSKTKRRTLPRRFHGIAEAFAGACAWDEILTRHGIQKISDRSQEQYWRKPNSSDGGHHATTNYEGSDVFYVFSTDFPPFDSTAYNKFEVYALLNHNGDFAATSRDLKDKGYGKAANIQEDLIEFARERLQLWHDVDGTGFASIEIDGHNEHYKLTDFRLRTLLEDQFFKKTSKIPHRELFHSAMRILEAEARLGPKHDACTRITKYGDDIYLDLCDEQWRAVRIRRSGWEIVEHPTVKFLRKPGMRALPVPVAADDLKDFLALVNIHDPDSQKLAVAWLIGALDPTGPYPLLALIGLHGCGKTTSQKAFKKLLDPCKMLLRTLPSNDRDLFIAASNSHVLGFDNVSIIRPWLSDLLCQLSSGAGFSTRELFSDDREHSVDKCCPIVINGIEDIIRRPDLQDRAVIIELHEIKEEDRIPEAEFWRRFDECHAKTLGYLLTAVSASLENRDKVKLARLPRMADFATKIAAAEKFLGWDAGSFMRAYEKNCAETVAAGLEAYPVVAPIRTLVSKRAFDGTATKLLELLIRETETPHLLPKTPNALTGLLRRLSPSLKQVGIVVEFKRSAERTVRLYSTHKSSSGASIPPHAA